MGRRFIIWALCACWVLGDADIETGSGTFPHKAPFISPHVIQRLFEYEIHSMEIADLNDQYSDLEYWIREMDDPDDFPMVCCDQELPYSICTPFFSYRFLRRLPNGIHVLYVVWSGGGSGIFHDLFFVNLKTATTLEFNEQDDAASKKDVQVIERVGRIALGDRYRPARPIMFSGNRIIIPETDGWFADHPDHTNCCQKVRAIDLNIY